MRFIVLGLHVLLQDAEGKDRVQKEAGVCAAMAGRGQVFEMGAVVVGVCRKSNAGAHSSEKVKDGRYQCA